MAVFLAEGREAAAAEGVACTWLWAMLISSISHQPSTIRQLTLNYKMSAKMPKKKGQQQYSNIGVQM